MWAPSVERGGGENGWADGLTGGALRAGPEPPTKTSGEICRLGQCRRREPRSFQQRRWPTLSWWGAVQWRTCSPPAGAAPGVDCGGGRGYRRCWADPMAGLANAGTRGLTSRRGHGGGAAVVVSGPDAGAGHPGGCWGLLRAGYRLRPGAVAGWGAWHGTEAPRARLETAFRRP